jgi:hypothetical protein
VAEQSGQVFGVGMGSGMGLAGNDIPGAHDLGGSPTTGCLRAPPGR